MNFKEKFLSVHPEMKTIVENFDAIRMAFCPDFFGYEDDSPCSRMKFECERCWNREMPEDKE